jgi:peptide/nickel transport system permease protein
MTEGRKLPRSIVRSLAAALLNLILVVLIGGFAAAALVRYSPGFDVDDNTWNPKISAATRDTLHAERERENHLPRFYLSYLGAALRGDFGQSDSLKQPVSELLTTRAGVTLALVAEGTAGGLILGALLAWLAVWPRRTSLAVAASVTSGLLLAIPPAVLALAFFFEEAPFALALALAVLPRVFGTLRSMLEDLSASSALLAARARGLGPVALGLRYVLGPALPRIVAVAGVALVLAFGFAIPIEALCDIPGVGQLAWKAALARDLPLLCGLALIITFIVALVQSPGDVAGDLNS